jgi:hypothetical protein
MPRHFIAENWLSLKLKPSSGLSKLKLRVRDWVEVRSKDEILATLDRYGRLEELPFMPQMFQYCGQRFRVFKRAHKTCDTVNPIRGRRVSSAVHLDLRCDGEAYGGCQAFCLIFWKVAWLKPVNEISDVAVSSSKGKFPEKNSLDNAISCTEVDVWKGTRNVDQQATDEPRYICQATQLPYFTTSLRCWDLRQYIEDFTSGNVTMWEIIRGLIYACYHIIARRRRLGRPFRWIYDTVQSLWGGIPFPRKIGTIPPGQSTPTSVLNLKPGELVRVKSYEMILKTLDINKTNRGLAFDAEMVPYCGNTYRVKIRVDKFIDEKSGRLIKLNSDAIILENVWCQSRYSNCRMFCPRSIYSWWREIWFERVSEGA